MGIERVKLQPSDAPSSSNLTQGREMPVSDDGPGRGRELGVHTLPQEKGQTGSTWGQASLYP